MTEKLPYFTEGEVVKGYGRGSKELGIPTGKAIFCVQLTLVDYHDHDY